MNIFLDCFPCFLKQALECARLSTDDPAQQKRIINIIMRILIDLDYKETPPHIARKIYRVIKDITSNDDPYAPIRKKDNKEMLAIYDLISEIISREKDRLYAACRIAAGINIIDSGTGRRKKDHGIEDIRRILHADPVIDDFEYFIDDLRNSKSLLYLGDNSGEIVLDKLFISIIQNNFSDLNIYFAVRGESVINDVTIDDARDTGMHDICNVISNGDSAPGTDIMHCSQEFCDIFNNADIIISKGQGNYETLSDKTAANIYYMLVAKCHVIAEHLGVEVGSIIIKKGEACHAYI